MARTWVTSLLLALLAVFLAPMGCGSDDDSSLLDAGGDTTNALPDGGGPDFVFGGTKDTGHVDAPSSLDTSAPGGDQLEPDTMAAVDTVAEASPEDTAADGFLPGPPTDVTGGVPLVGPAGYGPAAVSTMLKIAEKGEETTTKCFDIDYDGEGNNGFLMAAELANPLIADEIAAGGLLLLLEFDGVTGFDDALGFALNLYYGESSGGPASYYVYSDSFDQYGDPRFFYDQSYITDGTVVAGPFTMPVKVPLFTGVTLEFVMHDILLTADVAGSSSGVMMTDGRFFGVLDKTAIYDSIHAAQDACATMQPRPESCDALDYVEPLIPTLVKFDLDGGEAASVCLLFEAVPAIIQGVW